jgi:hypothetical protein
LPSKRPSNLPACQSECDVTSVVLRRDGPATAGPVTGAPGLMSPT